MNRAASDCLDATWSLVLFDEWSRRDTYDEDQSVEHLEKIVHAREVFLHAGSVLGVSPLHSQGDYRGDFPALNAIARATLGESAGPIIRLANTFPLGSICCASAHEAAFALLRLGLLWIEAQQPQDGLQRLSRSQLHSELARWGETREFKRLLDWRESTDLGLLLGEEHETVTAELNPENKNGAQAYAGAGRSKDKASDQSVPDDDLPKSKRAQSPSRVKARAAYDYAMAKIPDAEKMSAAELFDALRETEGCGDALPPTSETFNRYLNDCGIRLKKTGPKDSSGSVVRQSDL